MKRTYKIILILLTTFHLNSFSQAPSYEINGKININDGTIYLKSFRNKMFFNIDSAKIVKGCFFFKGSVRHTDLYGLSTDKNNSFSPYYMFLENCPIQVTIDTRKDESVLITGSTANDLFVKYHYNENYKIDSLISANPKSTVVAYLLYREIAPALSAAEIEANLALFDFSLKDLSYIKELKEIAAIKKSVEVGNLAPDFSGTTPDGKEIKLSDYLGNYLLLDFWASWCGPCRRENPNVVIAYNNFKSKGFSVFGVSLDKNKEDWTRAIKKDSLTWAHVSDLKFWDSAPAKLYGVRSIPSNFLLDPTGKIIARNLQGEDLIKKLKEVYGVVE